MMINFEKTSFCERLSFSVFPRQSISPKTIGSQTLPNTRAYDDKTTIPQAGPFRRGRPRPGRHDAGAERPKLC